MKKITFILKNAVLGLAHKKLLNILVVLSVAVGFLFLVYSLSYRNYVVKNYGTPPFKDVEHTVVADFSIKAKEEDEMEKKMLCWNENIKKAGFFAYYSTMTEYKGESFVGGVTGCNSDFLEVSNTILVSGRFPTEEEMESGAKVCLTTSTSGHAYKIGSTVNIGGTDFEIIGVFRDIRLYGGVLMPYKALYPVIENKRVQHKAYLLTEGELDVAVINSKVNAAAENVQFVLSGADSEVPMMERFKELMSENFKKSSVVLFFSIIGFTLIIAGRVLNEQYVLGVKTAVGATRFQMFLDLLFQNFLLIQIGAAITLLIYKGLYMVNDSDSFGLFDETVVAQIELICVAMAMFATCTAMIPILRQPVTELFRGSQD